MHAPPPAIANFSISCRFRGNGQKNRFTFLALVLMENPGSATVFVNISIICFCEIHLNFIVTKISVGSKTYSGRREESSLIWSKITDSGLLSQPETGSLEEPSEPMSWTVWRKAEESYSFYPGIVCTYSVKLCKCLSNLMSLVIFNNRS